MKLMQTQVLESKANRLRPGNRLPHRARQQDLAAMARKAYPGRRVDGQPHVPRIGQGRAAGVQADSDSDWKAVRPVSGVNLPLDGECRLEAGGRLLEDGEHLVRPGIDFAAAMLADRRS
jgi:hypothetical protein